MVRTLVVAALLLGRFTCSYTRTDIDGNEATRIRIISNPLLEMGLVPAWLQDLDGDGVEDLATEERWFLLRPEGWEECEPRGPTPPGPPDHLLSFEDVDSDGRIDRFFLEGKSLQRAPS